MEDPRVGELQELARVSDALAASQLAIPALRELAGAWRGTATTDDVHALIAEAASRLPDRQAGACRVLFADDTDRWTDILTDRRTAAAEHLGMSDDKFRKKRDGVSPYDELARALIAEMEAVAGEPARSPDGRSPSRWLVLVALALLLLVGAVAAIAASGGSGESDDDASEVADPDPGEDATDDSTTSSSPPGEGPAIPVDDCDIPVGAAFGGDTPSATVVEAMARAYDDHDHDDGPGCPVAVVMVWGALWIQPTAPTGGSAASPSWWIVAHDDGSTALTVPHVLHVGYLRIADPDGNLAQAVAGLPIAVVDAGTHLELRLDSGGLVVAEGVDAPARWLTTEVAALWRDLDGAGGPMGLPMTDPNFVDGVPRQDFAGGYGRLVDGSFEVEVLSEETIAEDVAALGRQDSMILETFDRTSWWVDETGTRRWIPDGGVWSCLGGDEVKAGDLIGGWVVATFPLGSPAVCP